MFCVSASSAATNSPSKFLPHASTRRLCASTTLPTEKTGKKPLGTVTPYLTTTAQQILIGSFPIAIAAILPPFEIPLAAAEDAERVGQERAVWAPHAIAHGAFLLARSCGMPAFAASHL